MSRHDVTPFLCGMAGLPMTCYIDSAFIFNSGILLMLIACLIWMRRQEEPDL